MTLLLIFSAIVNLSLSTVAVIFTRKSTKLEKSLRYTEACLERADENNRRMLNAINQQKQG